MVLKRQWSPVLRNHPYSQYRQRSDYTFTMRPPKAGSPPLPESPTNFKGSVPSKVFSVVVHPFISHTTNSCAYERGNQASPNAFVYIGGLTGGPHTANELLGTLLTALSLADLGYSIWEFRMRSSYTGWAHSTLDHDAADIASFIAYLRKLGKERIVLMGSSTGRISLSCQAPDFADS
jgi:hypothetical protein